MIATTDPNTGTHGDTGERYARTNTASNVEPAPALHGRPPPLPRAASGGPRPSKAERIRRDLGLTAQAWADLLREARDHTRAAWRRPVDEKPPPITRGMMHRNQWRTH